MGPGEGDAAAMQFGEVSEVPSDRGFDGGAECLFMENLCDEIKGAGHCQVGDLGVEVGRELKPGDRRDLRDADLAAADPDSLDAFDLLES